MFPASRYDISWIVITPIHLPGWISRLNGLQWEALGSESLGVEGECTLIITQKRVSVDFGGYIIKEDISRLNLSWTWFVQFFVSLWHLHRLQMIFILKIDWNDVLERKNYLAHQMFLKLSAKAFSIPVRFAGRPGTWISTLLLGLR